MKEFLLEENVLVGFSEGGGERGGTPADGLGAGTVDLGDSGRGEKKEGGEGWLALSERVRGDAKAGSSRVRS